MTKAHKNKILVYTDISQSPLSVDRHFGGATVQGSEYIYFPLQDCLVRGDLKGKFKTHLKQGGTAYNFKQND